MIKISPSILAADRGKLGKQVEAAEKGGANMIHIDFIDFVFVPNVGVGLADMKEAQKYTNLPMDVHLMCQNPAEHAKDFIAAGADRISFHYEAFDDNSGPAKAIKQIKEIAGSKKLQVGIALNPNTKINDVESFLQNLNFVLVMSVWPGKAGQKYIKGSENKIKELKSVIDRDKLNLEIEVDGGVEFKNAKMLKETGADILVAGKTVFGAQGIEKAIKNLKNT